MRIGNTLSILSQAINVIIFIYFAVSAIKINQLSLLDLSISAFGMFMSLIVNIISVIESD